MLPLKISTVVLPLLIASRTSVKVISSISTEESGDGAVKIPIASGIKPAVAKRKKMSIAALLGSDSSPS